MTETQKSEFIGKEVAELLFLKPNNKGEIKTEFGTKTFLGLGRTIERIIESSNGTF